MKALVVTGSTRGLGYGLAEAFLERGCKVMICGRSQQSVGDVLTALRTKFGAENVAGQLCDVTDADQVQAVWDAAIRQFGSVDVWINNAGAAHPALPVRELDPVTIKSVVDVNLTGTMIGARVAMRGMIAQSGGQIFNVEGYGSTGSQRREMPLTIYGTTKYAVRYFSRALALEAKGTPVLVGTLSPGMLATELITDQYVDRPEEWPRVRRILNIFAERVETVAPWLADRVLANHKNGAWINWLTPLKLASYFALAPFRKRDVFGEVVRRGD